MSIIAKDLDIDRIVGQAEEDIADRANAVDQIAISNQERVIDAFRKARLSEEYFQEKTGYGRDDAARETIDSIYAEVFQAPAAAVRMQFVSGTHALACAAAGNLKPGERLASLTGPPYDTMEEVIGISGDKPGSLKFLGVDYMEGDAASVIGEADADARLENWVRPLVEAPTACAYIQKSCGYAFGKKALSNREIRRLVRAVKAVNPRCMILVDNCYGEFVEDSEPPHAGADLVAGSLIKNPGGGLALTGGYIAGGKKYVEAALNRLTAPGIGGKLGLSYNQNRLMLQGLFLAPSVVSQALKGAMLFAHVFETLGFEVSPGPGDDRYDIIQGIKFGNEKALVNFCRALQSFSPVNPHVLPEPASMPGYQHKVIMAGGTFIEGSTIELSADGPLRPPYACYVQGGLSYLHIKLALRGALRKALSGDFPFLSV